MGYEIRNVDEIEIVFRRAAKIALTPPTGPVFVSLPGDILDEKCYPMNSKPTRISFDYKPTEKLLREVYECINQAKSPIVIAGYEIGLRNSFDEAEKFAKKLVHQYGNIPSLELHLSKAQMNSLLEHYQGINH